MNLPEYITNEGNYDNVNISNIFEAGNSPNVTTGYFFSDGTDVATKFNSYICGQKADPTGYKTSSNQDLSDIFKPQSCPSGFDFTGSPSINYVTSTLLIGSVTYNVITFRVGTFTFKSQCCSEIYQLFVVAGGANGVFRSGGNGGQVLSYGNNSVGGDKILVNTSNIFTLTVGAGGVVSGTPAGNSSSQVSNITGNVLNFTAIGGGGALGGIDNGSEPPTPTPAGNGTINIYNNKYYGGGGGASGGSRQPGLIGGYGGGGGGGGSYNGQSTTGTFNFSGGSGGGVNGSGSDGGSGGTGGSPYGTRGTSGTASQFGGGGGGGSWTSGQPGANGGNGGNGGGNGGNGGGPQPSSYGGDGGSGGGGGGGGYYGGGGGAGGQGGGEGLAGGQGGGGGAGTIILIYR